jgi:hypothetical protein
MKSQKQVTNIRPEDEVILCCARTSMDPERADLVKAILRQNIDWKYLMKTAQRHGLIPLLYKNLSDVSPEMVPEEVMKTFHEQYNANSRRNLFLTGELIKLFHFFESNGISAVPFKGPALAASVYGNLALRQFCDLDILIQKQDLLKVRDLMIFLGYVPEFQFNNIQAKVLIKYQYELHFVHTNRNIFMGLHWNLAPRYLNCPLVSEYLWKNARPVIGSSGFPVIQPEYLILMLCIHGTKDFWRQLIWVCDVAELIHVHKEMDWDFVLTLASNIGCQRMLFLGLFLAKDLLGASFPDEVLQKVKTDPKVKILAEQVKQTLFQGNDGVPGIGNFLFYLMSRERLKDKLLYCQRMITTISPQDWAFVELPQSLSFLYYFLRPIRLMIRYLLKIEG